jgi:VWFA-related protein
MHFRPRSYRRYVGWFLSAALVLIDCGSARTNQILQTEWNFPTPSNPRVVISNASLVSINTWDNNEVSIRAEVLAASIQAGEVSVKSANNRLEISCSPARPDRKIFLTVRAPAKALLWIESNGNSVQVSQPSEQQIIINNGSKELLQLSVPESSALDMKDARNAVERRQLGPLGNARIGISGQRLGSGPPFVKVNAPKALVVVVRGAIEPAQRPPTLAATTIARRGGPLGAALRQSAPHLIRPSSRVDQPDRVNPTDQEEAAVKLETYLVNLNVSATDRAGRAIPDLTKDDFIVYEDGVPQAISFFSPQQSPFNLVLLIDLSGSMSDEVDLIRETALHFLEVISSLDSVAVVTFTTDVVVVSRLTRDRDDLRDSIDFMLSPAGGTAFYDALGYALVEVLRKVKGQRNAVIAITDGEDNALQSRLELRAVGASVAQGSFLSFDELLEGAAENDALIYPLHFDPVSLSPVTSQTSTSGRNAPTVQIQTSSNPRKLVTHALTEIAKDQLRSLANASGGRFYHADRIEDLKGVFEQVASELRTIYSLAYTPTNQNFDGGFRRIRVQVNKPGVAIRTRPGYYGR